MDVFDNNGRRLTDEELARLAALTETAELLSQREQRRNDAALLAADLLVTGAVVAYRVWGAIVLLSLAVALGILAVGAYQALAVSLATGAATAGLALALAIVTILADMAGLALRYLVLGIIGALSATLNH